MLYIGSSSKRTNTKIIYCYQECIWNLPYKYLESNRKLLGNTGKYWENTNKVWGKYWKCTFKELGLWMCTKKYQKSIKNVWYHYWKSTRKVPGKYWGKVLGNNNKDLKSILLTFRFLKRCHVWFVIRMYNVQCDSCCAVEWMDSESKHWKQGW